ncbi:TetR/AcrR family transcriptional regulator [Streptosporangium carneum]|uniref:TetR family transcriptional regulator n=1 Tax=Streptosporangium carneum TaxID=47481 RepID=A0A9W6I4B7_9ACTN|nr:TetR/AcrR family transcriptional regulator [Streptosporangium carneum]GLK11166.1 TetR family transcriptional regulator [Streptosporangium carneum]
MGNREDLLVGARRCLEEKGWARTTVRDIAAAAGVSMAAIGYHFGSREALLNAALIQAIDEWGLEAGQTASSAYDDQAATPEERYEALWARLSKSFGTHRKLWVASIEALLQAEHSPELRDRLAGGQREGRRGLASILLGVEEDSLPESTVRTLGSVQLALLSGVMMQWLADPEQAPTGAEVVRGLRALMNTFEPAAETENADVNTPGPAAEADKADQAQAAD